MSVICFRAIMIRIMSVADIIASVLERSKRCRRRHCFFVSNLLCDNYECLLCACYLIDITRFWKSFFGMTIRFALPLGLTTRFMSLTGLTGKLALFVYAGVYVV